MVWWNPFSGVGSNTKPLFLAVYATVLVGLIFSCVYVVSSIYMVKPPSFALWSFSPLDSYGNAPSDVDTNSVDHTPVVARNGRDAVRNNVTITPHKELTVPLPDHKSMLMRPIWTVPPPGWSKLPTLENFRLTEYMIKSRAEGNVIIITFGNYAFMDFILNWVKHLTDLNTFNLLVGALDHKLLEALYWKGVPVFDMGSNMNTGDAGWGSSTFHKMGREKVVLINAILPFGYELLMCDTDMVWMRNPLPYIARYPDADILTSSDQVIPTVADERLEVWQEVSGAYNIGIFHWRPTNASIKLAKEWKDMLFVDENIWDQHGFNELTHKSMGPSVDEESGIFYAFDGTLKLGILPASIFCSGHTFFVQAMYQQLRLEPYAVHTTFQFAGTEGKRHRLREAMLFYDPPEYYDSPGGFISFKPNIPKRLLFDGDHTVESHFLLVNYQLKQIRAALAIALLLNRTLVMPPLWCRLDRLWFGHPGILKGTMTRQPFLCPLDHVFEVNVMLKEFPVEEFGVQIDFREYSFLDNPRLPNWVRDSKLHVELCNNHSPGCEANDISQEGLLRFPKRGSEEMLKRFFSQYKDVKILQFSSMADALQGFTDKVMEEKFKNRVKRYVGIWCCLMLERGHIYYDMYWDEKPGWKPVPPVSPEYDHPPWQG